MQDLTLMTMPRLRRVLLRSTRENATLRQQLEAATHDRELALKTARDAWDFARATFHRPVDHTFQVGSR